MKWLFSKIKGFFEAIGDIFTIIRLLWVYRDEIDLTADDPEARDD